MDFNEIIALYGIDVVLLTIANAALNELLRRTVLKGKSKAVTAVAYAAGIVMYIIYKSIYVMDAMYAFENLASVLEHGISIGTLTMLVCSLIDRFFGGGTAATATDTIVWILKRWVKSGSEKECANKILGLYKAVEGEQFKSVAADVVREYAKSGVSESQIQLVAALACDAAERLSEADDGEEQQPEADEEERSQPATT